MLELNQSVRAYRSIFLEEGWAHQMYFGWGVTEVRPGLRVLQKKRLAFTRSLMLLTKGGEAWLDEAVAQACGRGGPADVVVHDFDGVLSEPLALASRRFHSAEQTERVLNIATYVVDLIEKDETLWKNFGSKNRNLFRAAESNGVRFVDSGFRRMLEYFFNFYGPIARQYKLDTPNLEVLESMNKNGQLICVSCEGKNGKPLIVNLLYLTGTHSLYMYGASDHDAITSGAGQFIQWNTIMLLKKLGYRWYDLGGVQVENKPNGIYKFKKSLGGGFHSLGHEFRYETPGFAFMRACRSYADWLARRRLRNPHKTSS